MKNLRDSIKTLPSLMIVTALTASCASELGAPFPASFEMTGSNQFRFVASGTWEHPANTRSGEEARLHWLAEFLTKNHLCPAGYDIVDRQRERVPMSFRARIEDQELRQITYVGRCAEKARVPRVSQRL